MLFKHALFGCEMISCWFPLIMVVVFFLHAASRWHQGCCVGGQRALTLTFVGLRTIREASVPNVAFEQDGLYIRRRDWTLVATSIQSQGRRIHPTDRHAKATRIQPGMRGHGARSRLSSCIPKRKEHPRGRFSFRCNEKFKQNFQ